MVREVKHSDADKIVSIYNYYISNTTITFEEQPLVVADMVKRIDAINSSYPYLVYVHENSVVGYAYASRFRERSAYRYSAEMTVYIDHDYIGQGLGTKLYTELLQAIGQLDIKVVYGCIALPNKGSVRLHEKFGFKKVAHLTSVGYKFGQWIDDGYWELLLK